MFLSYNFFLNIVHKSLDLRLGVYVKFPPTKKPKRSKLTLSTLLTFRGHNNSKIKQQSGHNNATLLKISF